MENKNLPRDVFMYLLSIITLAMAAVNLGVLLFQFVNIAIPDPISSGYGYYVESYHSTMRWALATLVIVFPVYVWVARFLKKDLEQNPDKLESKIRKWFLYFTLFVASSVIIGDLVALVYNFLEGELTTRFFLKIASILFIAGSVFWYYIQQLRNGPTRKASIFGWSIVGLVTVAVIAGFVVAGSPQSQRLVNLDQRRVGDLSSIQWQITNYWQNKQTLPAQLTDLNNPLSSFMVPQDPDAKQVYEYMTTGPLSFKLCATFATDNTVDAQKQPSMAYDQNEYWVHAKGRQCFDRTIDPDLYPKPLR
jgi:hypothetical protein